jgi:hypothetical protein
MSADLKRRGVMYEEKQKFIGRGDYRRGVFWALGMGAYC